MFKDVQILHCTFPLVQVILNVEPVAEQPFENRSPPPKKKAAYDPVLEF